MAEWVFVALGSNLGDRAGHLAAARAGLARLPGTTLVAETAVEETAPLGAVPQGPYLNQMVLLRSILAPLDLLDACLALERKAGRVRNLRWGPRTLDLDIVRFGDRTIQAPRLTVPHPELPHRAFWQREIQELLPHVR